LRDAEANRKLRGVGQLQAFANPEHAAAAYEILIARLDWILSKYRTNYYELLASFRLCRSVIARLPQQTYNHILILQQERKAFGLLTREVKSIAKVTNAIVTRDALYSDHMYRLTAFKINFHRVIEGWAGLTTLMHHTPNYYFPPIIRKRFSKSRMRTWGSEIVMAKFEVQQLLDRRLQRPRLPLYHFKKAINFLHDTMKAQGGVRFVMAELLAFYKSNCLKDEGYIPKIWWTTAWIQTLEAENLRQGQAFRSISFYISSHVRARYDFQSVAQLRNGDESELPLYVKEGLELARLRLASPRVPLPKIRPNSKGIFPNFDAEDMAHAPLSDIFDLSEYQQDNEPTRAKNIETQHAGNELVDALPYPVAMVENQDLETSEDDELGDAESEESEAFNDGLNTALLQEEDETFDTLLIAFPSSHGKLGNHVYGEMLQRAKADRKVELDQQNSKEPIPSNVLPGTVTSRVKQSKTHVYAALLRELREQKTRWSAHSPVVQDIAASVSVSGPILKQWHPSYMRRSDARPSNYGSLLSRFKGLSPLGMPAPALPPSLSVPASVKTQKIEKADDALVITRLMTQDFPQSRLKAFPEPIQPADEVIRDPPVTSVYDDFLDRVIDSEPRSPRFRNVLSGKESMPIEKIRPSFFDNSGPISRYTQDPDDNELELDHHTPRKSMQDGNHEDGTIQSQGRGAGDSSALNQADEAMSFLPPRVPHERDVDTFRQSAQISQAQAEEMFKLGAIETASTFDLAADVAQKQELTTSAETSPDSMKWGVPELFKPRDGSILHNWTGVSKHQSVEAPEVLGNTSPLSQEAISPPGLESTKLTPVPERGATLSMSKSARQVQRRLRFLYEAKEKLRLIEFPQQANTNASLLTVETSSLKGWHLRQALREAKEKLRLIEFPQQANTNESSLTVEASSINGNSLSLPKNLEDSPASEGGITLSMSQQAKRQRERRRSKQWWKEKLHSEQASRQFEHSQGKTINSGTRPTSVPHSKDGASRESRDLEPKNSKPAPSTVTPPKPHTSDNNNVNQEILQELLTLRREMTQMREEMARMYANVAKGDAPPPTMSDVKVAEEKLEEKMEAVEKVAGEVKSAEKEVEEKNDAVRRVLGMSGSGKKEE